MITVREWRQKWTRNKSHADHQRYSCFSVSIHSAPDTLKILRMQVDEPLFQIVQRSTMQ